MCGIFGFLSTDGRGPDLVCLRRIAAETEARGRHAFGLAWIDADGAIQTFNRPGAATARLDDLDACRDAVAVIGHCRWATRGDPQDNHNNHPHPAAAGWSTMAWCLTTANSCAATACGPGPTAIAKCWGC